MADPQPSSDVGLKQSFASSVENRIFTDVEVAERLGVSRFTVRSWSEGRDLMAIPPFT